jgi:hypothetical protein
MAISPLYYNKFEYGQVIPGRRSTMDMNSQGQSLLSKSDTAIFSKTNHCNTLFCTPSSLALTAADMEGAASQILTEMPEVISIGISIADQEFQLHISSFPQTRGGRHFYLLFTMADKVRHILNQTLGQQFLSKWQQ